MLLRLRNGEKPVVGPVARQGNPPTKGRRDEGGIVRSIHGLTLRRCAPAGPACGCPNSFQTNLSNRGISSNPPSPPDTQNAPFGALCVSGGEGGIRTLGRL